MESRPTWMAVVAACIRDQEGRLLLQQCLPGKRHAGLWEFPGGKVENEEIPSLALCREIEEELALRLDPARLEPCGFAEEALESGDYTIVLFLYRALAFTGEPEGREGQLWGWFTRAEALDLPMPPMDRQLLQDLADWTGARERRPAR